MGAPKQKWTAEEEAALQAGVRKHGTGKWRTILTDPEFGTVLRLRSNVDLKDKWRNINVTAIWGSRQKAKLAMKKSPQKPKRQENSKALSSVLRSNGDLVDAKPLAISSGAAQVAGSKELLPRLDTLICEAITNLKEPRGSDEASIALYIEDKYPATHSLRKLLAGKLKLMVATAKLIKVKQKYMIASNSIISEEKCNTPPLLLKEKQKYSPKLLKNNVTILTKSQVEQELLKIGGMTALETAAAAAKAVAEAEAAIAEAEEAAREAEAAEAEAEAAQVFARAAIRAFKYRMHHSEKVVHHL